MTKAQLEAAQKSLRQAADRIEKYGARTLTPDLYTATSVVVRALADAAQAAINATPDADR